jgi:predicted transcriptional regulator YheO
VANTDRQMYKYIIVANHDRQECGVESIDSEECAMREIANYQKNGRNIDGYVSEFPSREAAEANAKAKHEEYHFLGDYKDVVKEMESDPRPR